MIGGTAKTTFWANLSPGLASGKGAKRSFSAFLQERHDLLGKRLDELKVENFDSEARNFLDGKKVNPKKLEDIIPGERIRAEVADAHDVGALAPPELRPARNG